MFVTKIYMIMVYVFIMICIINATSESNFSSFINSNSNSTPDYVKEQEVDVYKYKDPNDFYCVPGSTEC